MQICRRVRFETLPSFNIIDLSLRSERSSSHRKLQSGQSYTDILVLLHWICLGVHREQFMTILICMNSSKTALILIKSCNRESTLHVFLYTPLYIIWILNVHKGRKTFVLQTESLITTKRDGLVATVSRHQEHFMEIT